MKKYGNSKKSVQQSIMMITQFSLNMLIPIGMMSALGIWLDTRLSTWYWTIVLFSVGALAGGQNIYRMAKRICGEEAQSRESSISHEDNRGTEKKK